MKNGYNSNNINKHIKRTVNKLLHSTEKQQTVEPQIFTLSVPYAHNSNIFKQTMNKSLSGYGPCKLRILFETNKIASYFNNKCKIPLPVESNAVYKFTCHGCEAVYLGETERHLHYRQHEHGQPSRKSAIFDHNMSCNKRTRAFSIGEFKIIAKRFHTKQLRLIREAIEIKNAGDTINMQVHDTGSLLAVLA